MKVKALFGRFVWCGVNIDDVTIHPFRDSRINPTLKVCEHNRVAYASTVTGIQISHRFPEHNANKHFGDYRLILHVSASD